MPAATIMGLSTLGVKLAYAFEAEGYAGEKPRAFTTLDRINSIGGITITPATIDASALEDMVTKTVAGRGDTGGTWTITVNFTKETRIQWTTLINSYYGANGAKSKGLGLWLEVLIPGISDLPEAGEASAFFVVCEPPTAIPLPEIGQNSLLTVEFPMVIVDPKGMLSVVAPT